MTEQYMEPQTRHFKMKLAEVVFDVTALYERTEYYCRKYVTDEPAECSVVITPEDIRSEKEYFGDPDAKDAYLERLALHRKVSEYMIGKDTILFHSSAVSADGNGYLFTAPSGTGKSTHARLWRENIPGTEIINDDKPLIRVTEQEIRVYGTPWMGKHYLGQNKSVPVKGICYLRQAPENRIRKLSADEALPLLLSQTYRSPDRVKMLKTLALLDMMSRKIDIYELECTVSAEAAELSYNTMCGGIHNETEE